MFKDYGDAVRATFVSTRPSTDGKADTYTLTQVASNLESIERALDKARSEIDGLLAPLVAFRQAGHDATREQAVKALSEAAGLARSARASGTVQSEIAGATAKAGFLQGIIETGLITEATTTQEA
jgi:hypothetical protein